MLCGLRCKPYKRKHTRAYGGCLGIAGRGRTRKAAKSCGESHKGCDPQVSEWGNPSAFGQRPPIYRRGQRGELKHLSTPRKREQVSDSASSGERTRISPNLRPTGRGGCRAHVKESERRRSGLESRPTEGDRPVDASEVPWWDSLSKAGPEKSCLKRPAPSGKAKYWR